MGFMTYRAPKRKQTRTTTKTVEAALARYAQRHGKTIGYAAGKLSLSIWGSDPTWYQVFDMAHDGAGNPLCGPRCGKDMVEWLDAH